MQVVQLAPQLGDVLFVHHGVEQGVAVFARQFLPMNDLFQQGVFVQQRFHLLEVILHIFGVVMFLVGIGHGALLGSCLDKSRAIVKKSPS